MLKGVSYMSKVQLKLFCWIRFRISFQLIRVSAQGQSGEQRMTNVAEKPLEEDEEEELSAALSLSWFNFWGEKCTRQIVLPSDLKTNFCGNVWWIWGLTNISWQKNQRLFRFFTFFPSKSEYVEWSFTMFYKSYSFEAY